jgi:mRNA-degrading endonuclease RelE of RelBE toxin-antitoxin system
MSYNINSTPFFEKEFKKLFKKYPSLKKDLISLRPKQSPIISLHIPQINRLVFILSV